LPETVETKKRRAREPQMFRSAIALLPLLFCADLFYTAVAIGTVEFAEDPLAASCKGANLAFRRVRTIIEITSALVWGT
jgi:hypothetical protein